MKKTLFESRNKFNHIDGERFGACLNEARTLLYHLEWRIRKADGALCIIQLKRNGQPGYDIYAIEA